MLNSNCKHYYLTHTHTQTHTHTLCIYIGKLIKPVKTSGSLLLGYLFGDPHRGNQKAPR